MMLFPAGQRGNGRKSITPDPHHQMSRAARRMQANVTACDHTVSVTAGERRLNRVIHARRARYYRQGLQFRC
jgi:hypothetical protein